MDLNKEQFINALDIISKNHTSVVALNQPRNGFVGNIGQTEFRIHIKQCVPAVINNLIAANYTLSMTEQGLEVSHL